MGGIPAFYLWDLVIEVLHSSKNTHQAVRNHCRKEKVDDQVPRSRARSEIQSTNPNIKSKRSSNRDVVEFSNVNHVVTNASSSQFEAQDNEVAVKLIIKDRSPTMRQVSRTHRVALDWLCDRVSVDSQSK